MAKAVLKYLKEKNSFIRAIRIFKKLFFSNEFEMEESLAHTLWECKYQVV